MTQSAQLPPNPNLQQLRNQSKDLCKAHGAGNPDALRRIQQSHPSYSASSPAEIAAAQIALADAQLVIARELGFDSWPRLKNHIESLSSIEMHELVTKDDLQMLAEAVAGNPRSVNQQNESGLPPLYTAALYGNQQAIDFLLDQGAVVDIFAAAYLGKPATAEALLQRNPELARATTADGMTPLHYAARAGHYDVAEILVRNHADVDARAENGKTPLIEASHGGPWKREADEEIIQLLLNHNAKVDLFAAAAIGNVKLVQAVLDKDGTLIDDLNDREETALFVAAHNNQFAAVRLFVESGADVNRSDAVGAAALHRTSQQCSDELIQYLIDHGADAHLCCYVACGDESGTRQSLARDPQAANEIFYEFNAVGYAIHSWQLGTLRILLQHGSTLSEEDQQHILRISGNDRELLQELLAISKAN